MSDARYQLISFKLCPFVQRTTLTLQEKGVPYDVDYIDLADKPQWFLDISPLGKVPVLRVGDTVVFESAVINEFVEETTGGGLHPADPLARAHNRSWIEFASSLLFDSYSMYLAKSREATFDKAEVVRNKLARFEEQIKGPLFNGEDFSLVDAATAPLLQRLDWYQQIEPDLDLYRESPKGLAWRDALVKRPSFAQSTVPDIEEQWRVYMRKAVDRAPSTEQAPWLARQAQA
ncbi:MAG: glutathione S-transferase family protein [Myxococcales bacterium FL481]|nr:MAG: glutathione S-transferase family protein [Myxococcales bacterium FL481]